MTFDQAIESFLFHCQYEKNLSPKTLKAYAIDLEQFKRRIDERDVQAIDKTVLREYIQALHATYKPKTIKRKIATMKAFFNHLEFEDSIVINPFRKMMLHIKEPVMLPKALDVRLVKRLFRHLYTSKAGFASPERPGYHYRILMRDIAVLELLFTSGLRVAELCSIGLADVDFGTKTIRIMGKGSRERVIPFGQVDTVRALKEYQECFSSQMQKSGYFFLNRFGDRLSTDAVRELLRHRASEAGIEQHVTPHMLRHSVATLLLENGVDIRYIQALLGHSSIATTQIYTKINSNQHCKIITQHHPRKAFSFT